MKTVGDRPHLGARWAQGLQIYKTGLVSSNHRAFSVMGRWEEAGGGWRACSAKVTFCSVPRQPEGSALSGAKPTCNRVNKKRISSQRKLTYNVKSASILKVSGTSCWHKTRQVFNPVAQQQVIVTMTGHSNPLGHSGPQSLSLCWLKKDIIAVPKPWRRSPVTRGLLIYCLVDSKEGICGS